MFSYIFMKILESRPRRYDRGLQVLTGGHAKKIKKQIVSNWIRPGMNVLDVGCGTGELLALAAEAGANVTGIDISEGMLSVARKRMEASNSNAKVSLYHAGITELDELFAHNAFDAVTATLVFSELYPAERTWVLNELNRILKPSGVLIIADEVPPRTFIKRLVYTMIRIPSAIAAYLIAQSGTTAIPRLAETISQAGFTLLRAERLLCDSFAVVCARKKENDQTKRKSAVGVIRPQQDTSMLKSIWDFIGRWFPNPVAPGLRRIGNPDTEAPVLVTSNFHLTVRRVEKALSAADAWLLVAPTGGINVWCASAGGEMTEYSLKSVIKTSRIQQLVSHRRLIVPQLSAPGIDRKRLAETTGWSVDFGPVYAKDIPSFLDRNRIKTVGQSRARYPIGFRLEMLFCMNALVWAVIGAVLMVINPVWAAGFSAFFWGAGIILYAGYPFLPGRSAWLKAAVLSLLLAVGISLYSVFIQEQPWWHSWGWMTGVALLNLWLGFDLKGIVGGNISEAESLLHKLGAGSIGKIHKARTMHTGAAVHHPDLCTNCGMCVAVCPQAVFIRQKKDGHVTQEAPGECLRCHACLKQCDSGAISFQ